MPTALVPPMSNNTSHAVSSLRELKRSHIAPLPNAPHDEACCICLNLYNPSHKAVTVLIPYCYHRFGQNCLEDYLNSASPRNNTCPQCRREWYRRQPSWMSPWDVNLTESMLALSLPREPERVEPQARAYRPRRNWEYEQTPDSGLITSHLDEIFRRLDIIQNISQEQHTLTASTRVRLQAVERRAGRLHRELQDAYEDNTHVQLPPSGSEQLLRHREREPREAERAMRRAEDLRRTSRRETTAHGFDFESYSLASSADTRTTLSSTPDGIPPTANMSINNAEDVHQPPASPPSEDPISPSQYAAYMEWYGLSDDDSSRIREPPQSPTANPPIAHRDIARDVWSFRPTLFHEPRHGPLPIPSPESLERLQRVVLDCLSSLRRNSAEPLIARTPTPPRVSPGQPEPRVSVGSVMDRSEVSTDARPFASGFEGGRNGRYWSRSGLS